MFRPARRDDHWDRQLATADSDHAAFLLLVNHVFPIESLLGAEVAQLRTFAIPTISRLLHATGRYEHQGQRRVDDTRAILTAIGEDGAHTDSGRAMIDHLNGIHSHYRIANDDYIATLAALVIEPMRVAARLGFRSPTAAECAAVYGTWRAVGARMGITGLPETYPALCDWQAAYEAHACRPDPANTAVARGLLAVFAAQLPRPLRPLAEPVTVWVLDDAVVTAALGLSPPEPWLHRALDRAAALRRGINRRVDWWRHQAFWQTRIFRDLPSYPDGHQRQHLGPPELLAKMARQPAPPSQNRG